MTELTKKQSKLLKDLEDVRSDMETLLEDETVLSLPKAFKRVKDSFDSVIVALECGEYNEETSDE